MAESDQLTLNVESAWGAVAGLPRLRFPRPLAEPDVRLSPHPALHRTHAGGAMTAQRCSLVCISRTRTAVPGHSPRRLRALQFPSARVLLPATSAELVYEIDSA